MTMTSAPVEDDQCQMCGRFVGQTYVPQTYVCRECSNTERERKEKKNKRTYLAQGYKIESRQKTT